MQLNFNNEFIRWVIPIIAAIVIALIGTIPGILPWQSSKRTSIGQMTRDIVESAALLADQVPSLLERITMLSKENEELRRRIYDLEVKNYTFDNLEEAKNNLEKEVCELKERVYVLESANENLLKYLKKAMLKITDNQLFKDEMECVIGAYEVNASA